MHLSKVITGALVTAAAFAPLIVQATGPLASEKGTPGPEGAPPGAGHNHHQPIA